jgi:hypothetical protein
VKRPLQQCVALLQNGTRCGKFAKDGEQLCAVHRPGYVPKGAAVPKPKVLTHQQRLEMFARSSDERIAMQAISLLEKRRGTNDPEPRETCAALVAALTDDEREELSAIIAELKAFKERIYLRRPDLRPAGYLVRAEDAPLPVVEDLQQPPPAEPLIVAEIPSEPEPTIGQPFSLSSALYAEVGLETLSNGAVTHPLGDEHAQRILDGSIPFDEARAAHDASLRELDRLGAPPTKPFQEKRL